MTDSGVDAGTDLALPDHTEAMRLLVDLEAAGAVDEVSLILRDEMSYERWENLGRFLGSIGRRANWYISDWLIYGEAVFGEESAQGIEATTAERYSEAERTTGLDHGTMMNIRSVGARVTRDRRRHELGFWIHQEVAALEPSEQVEWLQRAIDNGWTKSELRDAIRDAKNPPGDDPEPEPAPAGEPGLSVCDRIEEAATRVYHQAQPTSDGSVLVPAEPWAAFAAALGFGE